MKKFLFIFSFIIIIFSNLIAIVVGKDSIDPALFKSIFSRAPNSFQIDNYSFNSFETIFEDFQLSYEDEFRIKNELIGLYSYCLYKFDISIKPEIVQIGKNNMLFLGNFYKDIFDVTLGVKQPNIVTDRLIDSHVTKLGELSNRYKVNILKLIVPNKHSVYPENLPFLNESAFEYYSYTKKKLIDGAKEYNKFEVLDLKSSLLNYKSVYDSLRLYQLTDSHWNIFGAYLGYKSMVEYLNKTFDYEVETVDIYNINFKYVESKDLAKKIGLYKYLEELEYIIETEEPLCEILPFNFNSRESYKENKKLVYVRNTDKVTFLNKCAKYKVLVIGDSFKTSMSKLINETFNEVSYLHQSMEEAKDLENTIRTGNYDLVLFITVERLLEESLN